MDMNSKAIGSRLQNGALTSEQVGAYNIYKGARYVPKIMGQWDANVNYEPLSIVINQGNSYTSAQYVPAGVPLQVNGPYWYLTGNFNGQLESINQELEEIKATLKQNVTAISTIQNLINNTTYLPFQDLQTDANMTNVNGIIKAGSYTLKVGYNSKAEYPYLAGDSNALFVCNASFFNTETFALLGVNIQDGKILSNDVSFSYGESTPTCILVWNENGRLSYVENQSITSAQDILDAGWTNALQGAYPLIVNGQQFYKGSDNTARAWCGVGQDLEGNLYFYNSFENRNMNSQFKMPMIEWFKSKNVDFAYMFDGGGSSQTSIMGTQLSPINLENNYRAVPGFFIAEAKADTSLFTQNNKIIGMARQIGTVANGLNLFANKVTNLTESVRFIGSSGIFRFSNPAESKVEESLEAGDYLCLKIYDNSNGMMVILAVNESLTAYNVYMAIGISTNLSWINISHTP